MWRAEEIGTRGQLTKYVCFSTGETRRGLGEREAEKINIAREKGLVRKGKWPCTGKG